MNRPNQNVAITRAGSRVDSSAETDVEFPTPRPLITSDAVLDGFHRAESMLGSSFWSCQATVSTCAILGNPQRLF